MDKKNKEKTAVKASVCPGEGYSPRTHDSEAPVTVWKCGLINKIM